MPAKPLALLLALFAGPALSQTHSHQPGMTHGASPAPTEPGQGAFAAIAEITALLAADPSTDWSRVNITALRDHLVDMDLLVTQTTVMSRPVPGGLEMTVSTLGPGGAAASRMLPAHGPVLTDETGWTSTLARGADTLVWTVTSPGDTDRIRALGFYGLMASGDHHRAHHMALARGMPPH